MLDPGGWFATIADKIAIPSGYAPSRNHMDAATRDRIYHLARLSSEPELLDLAGRFHRAEHWTERADGIRFTLERHPDGYTSVQSFRYNATRDVLEFLGEEVTELHVSAKGYCRQDVERYFDNGCDSVDFYDCSDTAELEKRAWSLGRQFGDAVAESFSVGGDLEMSQAIMDRIEAIRREIVDVYPEIFVDTAVRRLTKER